MVSFSKWGWTLLVLALLAWLFRDQIVRIFVVEQPASSSGSVNSGADESGGGLRVLKQVS